jgi:hypothetical protein
LPVSWARRSYIGISASTGQLADNHDILSLSTYSDSDPVKVDAEENSNTKKRAFAIGADLPDLERVLRLKF